MEAEPRSVLAEATPPRHWVGEKGLGRMVFHVGSILFVSVKQKVHMCVVAMKKSNKGMTVSTIDDAYTVYS